MVKKKVSKMRHTHRVNKDERRAQARSTNRPARNALFASEERRNALFASLQRRKAGLEGSVRERAALSDRLETLHSRAPPAACEKKLRIVLEQTVVTLPLVCCAEERFKCAIRGLVAQERAAGSEFEPLVARFGSLVARFGPFVVRFAPS